MAVWVEKNIYRLACCPFQVEIILTETGLEPKTSSPKTIPKLHKLNDYYHSLAWEAFYAKFTWVLCR